jgi:methylornithine synthase
VLRLVFPDRLIPASLDVEGLDGLGPRLEAGANVVTSLVPPGMGLGGVANASLDIEEARRTPAGISSVLAESGLRTAGLQDYVQWMTRRRSEARDVPARGATCG